MKIAVFHELARYSGARKAVDEYGKFLSKSNIVDLFYVDEQIDSDEEKIFNKARFFKFRQKSSGRKRWLARLYKDTFGLLKLFLLHQKIGRLINSSGYDIVFIHPSRYTQSPFVLRNIESKKVYYCQEPLRMVYEDSFAIPITLPIHKKLYEMLNRNIKKYIDKFNLNAADLILTNSEFTKNNIFRAYGKNATVCYLAVDSSRYRFMDINKTTDIIFLGSKDPIEGYNLLKDSSETFKAELSIRTISSRDTGKGIDEDLLVKEYNKSNMAVCLSINEPFGLIPLEAMACELPVIAVDEGGYRESIINNETGFLIKRDKKELAQKIKFLLDNPILARQMGIKGRREVLRNWTWEKSGQELEDKFKELI